MKRKVMSTRDVESRGGISRELTLECGHTLWRAGSWPVPVRADCKVCTLNPGTANTYQREMAR